MKRISALFLLLGIAFMVNAQNDSVRLYDTTNTNIIEQLQMKRSLEFNCGYALEGNKVLIGGEGVGIVTYDGCDFTQGLFANGDAPSDWIVDIFVDDATKDIWIASANGIWWAKGGDLDNADMINTTNTLGNLPTLEVKSLAVDSNGWLWIGHGLGVTRWKTTSLVAIADWKTYTTMDGLAHDKVNVVRYHEPTGDLFAGTENGASRFVGAWASLDTLGTMNVRDIVVNENTGDVVFASYGSSPSHGINILKNDGTWEMFGSGTNPSKPLSPGFYQTVGINKDGLILAGSITAGLAVYDGFNWQNYRLTPDQTLVGDFAKDIIIDRQGNALVTIKNTLDQTFHLMEFNPSGIKMNVHFENVSHVLCHGDSTGAADARACLPSPPANYDWASPLSGPDSSFSNMPAGTYNVTATDVAMNVAYGEIKIEQPSAPLSIDDKRFIKPTSGTSNDASVAIDISGGTPPYSVQWSDPLFQTGDSVGSMPSGGFMVEITDDNGCTYREEIWIPWPVSVKELNGASANMEVRPNPTSNYIDLYIASEEQSDVHIEVMDISGKVVKSISNDLPAKAPQRIRIDSEELTEGFYFVRAKGDNWSLTRKVLLAH